MSKPSQISIGLGTAFAIITVVTSILVSYYASAAAASDKVAAVAQDVAVLKDARASTEEALKDLAEKTDRIPYIEGKIDAALGKLQVNPHTVEATVFKQSLTKEVVTASSSIVKTQTP